MKMNILRKLSNQYRMKLPIIFGNSFPKSGTHLLLQILNGFSSFGPFTPKRKKIVTYEKGIKRSAEQIRTDIGKLKPGTICGGHLQAYPEVISELSQPHLLNYFIYRDPRDVVVSHAFYVTEMAPRHIHHEYYTTVLKSTTERITTSISGRAVSNIDFPDIGKRYEPYLPWLETPNVLPLRFENLISSPRRNVYIIIQHAQKSGFFEDFDLENAQDILVAQIQPSKSKTFREGKSGNWKQHFTNEHKVLFKDLAGDLLIRLGYEKSFDW